MQTASALAAISTPTVETRLAPIATATKITQRRDESGRSSTRHATQSTNVATNASAVYCLKRVDMSMWAGAVASSPRAEQGGVPREPAFGRGQEEHDGRGDARSSAERSCAVVGTIAEHRRPAAVEQAEPGEVSPDRMVSPIDEKWAPTPTQASSSQSDEMPTAPVPEPHREPRRARPRTLRGSAIATRRWSRPRFRAR